MTDDDEHHVETFLDGDGFGWQCLTCRAEEREYATFDQAYGAGLVHAYEPPF